MKASWIDSHWTTMGLILATLLMLLLMTSCQVPLKP